MTNLPVPITVQRIADVLTDALKTDPAAINALFSLQVPCNQKIVDHPTVVCRWLGKQDATPMLTLAGLLQCIAVLTGEDKRLAAVYHDGHIFGFMAIDRAAVDPGPLPPSAEEK